MSLKLSINGVLGLGSVSTQYYLGEIQRKFKEKNKEFSTCSYLLYQIDFQAINSFLPDHFSILKPKIDSILNQILSLGISKLLVPNITLHETLDKIESPIKLYHPVNLTIDYLIKNKTSKITLFGTLYTMNSDYLNQKFSEKSIEVIIPSERNQAFLDKFRKSVYNQDFTINQITVYQDLIKEYSRTNPVVIACTELSVFSLKNNAFCIDMADLQIDEFLK